MAELAKLNGNNPNLLPEQNKNPSLASKKAIYAKEAFEENVLRLINEVSVQENGKWNHMLLFRGEITDFVIADEHHLVKIGHDTFRFYFKCEGVLIKGIMAGSRDADSKNTYAMIVDGGINQDFVKIDVRMAKKGDEQEVADATVILYTDKDTTKKKPVYSEPRCAIL